MEENEFKSAMQDVTPLKTSGKVRLVPGQKRSPGLQARRAAAVDEGNGEQAAPLSLEHIEPVGPHDFLSYQRPGVQHGVFKNLRLGKYPIDARLDLHRMSVAQARNAILRFIRDCLEHDVRCALITHGKGEGRKPQPAMLKSCVATWLPQLEEILAFHSAQKHHGGVGATYILLRKSERKKRSTWERHIGRRP